jgi:hypothetical protein
MPSPAPPISIRHPHLAGRRRAEPERHHAPGRRRTGRARAELTGAMDHRPPVRNDRCRFPLGRNGDCLHAICAARSPEPQFFPHGFSLSGCTRFATSEMHLCRDSCRFVSQVAIGMGFKTFLEKSKLRVRTPSRDGMRAIVTPRTGLGTDQNRPKSPRFGGFLPGFGPVLRGRRPTSRPTGSGPLPSTEMLVLGSRGLTSGRSETGRPSRPRHSHVGSTGTKTVDPAATQPGPGTRRDEFFRLPPRPTVPPAAAGWDPTDIALPTVGRRAGMGL